MNLFYIIFFFFTDGAALPTVALDSSYTETQLNKILIKARKEKDRQMLADVYYKLGQIENNVKANPVNAFEYYTRSLDYYKILQDTVSQNIVNERIADHYKNSEFYDEALNIYENLMDYYESKSDLYNQMNICLHMSEVYQRKGDLEKEQQIIQNCKILNNQVRDTSFMIRLLLHEVENFEELNELDSAEVVAYRVFTLATLADKEEYIGKSLFHLGRIQEEKFDFAAGQQYFTQSLEFESDRKYNTHKLDTYKHLSDCYRNLADFENAYLFAEKYVALKDSIFNHERLIAINNISQKYESRVKKKEIKILELEKNDAIDKHQQQNRALTVLTIGFGLLTLALYYIMRFYSQKIKSSRIIAIQKEQINEQRIRELEDSFKIKGMQSMLDGQELERERIAKDLHDSLGALLSTVKLQFENVGTNIHDKKALREYKKASTLIDSAVDEVRSISRNLQPGALRNLGLIAALKDLVNQVHGENHPEIHFQHYDFPDKLPNMISLSIYRVIQEMLNNAIKHSKAKEILLQLTTEGDEIVILFEDDGIGFDMEKLDQKGMGLDNIRSRIDYLNGTLHFDSRIGEGTTYLVHINPALTDAEQNGIKK